MKPIATEEYPEIEYISEEEIIEGIRLGLLEVKEARNSGEREITLQELIDEIDQP